MGNWTVQRVGDPALRKLATDRLKPDVAMNSASRWLVIALALGVTTLAWLSPLDQYAQTQAQAGLRRALATFAVARALNGVISVAQGTEVAVEPAGVGLTFTPGQVLDPINDLVEQFSSLMLMASVSFGVQGALLAIGGHWLLSLLMTMVLGAWLWRSVRGNESTILDRILLLLILVRFAIPMAALGSDATFHLFLADRYQQSQAALSLSGDTLGELATPVPPEPVQASLGGRLQRWWSEAGDTLDITARLQRLQDAAASVTEHIVELIVVFLLQTLILPLLLLLALWKGTLTLLRIRN